MAEYAKKTVTGYKIFPCGAFDEDATHIILSKEEYEPLIWANQNLNQELWNAKHQNEELISKMNERTQALNQALREADAKTEEWVEYAKEIEDSLGTANARLIDMQEELANQKRLNENLLRISKERANSDRGLIPKKEHTGFAVISSTERKQRYTSEGSYQKVVVIWETIIQTPYTSDLTEEDIRKLIQQEETFCLLQKLGITEDFSEDYEKMSLGVIMRKCKDLGNVLLEWTLRVNYKRGYWELRILHAQPIGVVPKEMRPVTKSDGG